MEFPELPHNPLSLSQLSSIITMAMENGPFLDGYSLETSLETSIDLGDFPATFHYQAVSSYSIFVPLVSRNVKEVANLMAFFESFLFPIRRVSAMASSLPPIGCMPASCASKLPHDTLEGKLANMMDLLGVEDSIDH